MATIPHIISLRTNMACDESQGGQSRLLTLPKELRLTIYEYALSDLDFTEIGKCSVNSEPQNPSWTAQPGFLRACSLLRREALPIYHEATHFTLGICSGIGLRVVLEWIHRCSRTCPSAFQKLQYVSIMTGPREPRHYILNFARNKLVAVISQDMSSGRLFSFSPVDSADWSRTPVDEVTTWLQRMPERESPDFDVAKTLRVVIEILVKHHLAPRSSEIACRLQYRRDMRSQPDIDTAIEINRRRLERIR